MKVGILGGTGPAGRGLGLRLAVAGHDVTLGSRDQARAEAIAAELCARVPGDLPLSGQANAGAAESELVVVATPWDSAIPTVTPLAEALAGKVVVSMVVALIKQGREMQALQLARGSAAAAIQAVVPHAQVAAAFHHLPASELEDLDSGLSADVLVCSDHPGATQATKELVSSMEGFRPVDAGSLAQAGAIEAFTGVCISINMRHKVHSTVRMVGL